MWQATSGDSGCEQKPEKDAAYAEHASYFSGAALLGFGLTIRYRQFIKIRFGLLLVLTLWAEYSLVFGIGRYSLDTVPILAVVFGTGMDAWMKQKVGGNQVTPAAKLGLSF